MPELPEVETVVKGLKSLVKDKIIEEVEVREPKLIGFPSSVSEFISRVSNSKILDLNRRGKYILIQLDREETMVIHLRMTGKLLVKPRELSYDKHTHIIFKLNDNIDLRFNNIRKFGRIYLVKTGDWKNAGGLGELGPEPLSKEFTLSIFKDRIKNRTAGIKSLLLNQSFIAGMGNIYTDEALFRAGILPDRKADTLSDKEIEKLYNAIRNILKLGIKYGGTSFSDYVNAMGEKGKFQQELMVYQRQGEKCPKCEHEIVKEKIAGRGTHYCPSCQK